MGLSQLSMGAHHLAGQGGTYEPQRNNNGLLVIYGLGDNVSAGGPDSTTVLSLEGFKIPEQANEVLMMHYLNADRKVAGRKRLDAFDVRYKDMVDQRVAATLWAWRNLVMSPTSEAIGYAAGYKRRGEILLLGPDGGNVRRYTLEGLWPSSLNHGQIDMNGNDKLLVEMTIQIDRMYPVAESFEGGIKDALATRGIGALNGLINQAIGAVQGGLNRAATGF